MRDLYLAVCDIGEQASQIADVLQRENIHELSRASVACRDLSFFDTARYDGIVRVDAQNDCAKLNPKK